MAVLQISSTNDEQVVVEANPANKGRPAQLDGALRVAVVSGDGTFVQDPAKPLEVTFRSGNAAGVTVYSVRGDADRSAGERLIEDTVEYTVTEPEADELGLVASDPEPKA